MGIFKYSSNFKKYSANFICNNGSYYNKSEELFGGVVGALCNGTISECFSSGSIYTISISGGSTWYTVGNCGGVGGYILSSKIYNSYNTGSMNGNGSVGGVIGFLGVVPGGSVRSYIYNCYNSNSSVTGNAPLGNLIGGNEYVTGDYLYWIKGKEPLGTNVGTDYKIYAEYTIDDMKGSDSEMLKNLQSGIYGSSDIWGQDDDINVGLPYLKNNIP